jgi:PAS domain S-box-containing protein
MPVKPGRPRSKPQEAIGSVSSRSVRAGRAAARHSFTREERDNAQLAAVVAASDDAIISLGTDFVVRTWNAGAQQMFGYAEAEARAHRLTELIIPDVDKEESATILAAVLNGETVLKELLRRHKDGHLVPVEINTSPIRDCFGRVIGTSVIYRDISERRRAKETRRALADSEARFRVTFENAPVGIASVAPDGRWLTANEAMCRLLGYPADELTTKSYRDILHPDDLAAAAARLEEMCLGKIERFDATDRRFLHKNGTIVWVMLTVSCVRNSDGAIDYFAVVVEDITARKQAEEELRKSEERFRSSVLLSPLPTLLYDDREQILALSQSWLEGSSYVADELRHIEDWTARAYGERSGQVLEYIRRIIRTEPQAQLCEMTIRTKDGRERLWTFVCSALGTQSDGRRLFLCVAQDVTDRKAYEDQILFLMHEVNHRAKNMLSLVQAVARQTAAREPEDFIGRFNERIQALAANQDLLVRNDWQGVYVEDLVRAQLAHFADVGARIAVEGPKLHLNGSAAQALGLALHELATNAGKYGALSVAVGRVDVRWRLEDDTFMMSWTERNGPPVSPPERSGFGSTVLDSMATLSVGGEVKLDYAPSGLTWRLMCPAANAMKP